ncbi:MAG: gamma-glutamyltransferase, partial [Alphaproteobacteria bacterium]
MGLLTLAGLLTLTACGSSDTPVGEIGAVEGFLGGVTADAPRAALIGRETLSAGGTAMDAAVAMYFAMAVTLPDAAGLGGGGVCLIHDNATALTETL